MDTNGHSYDTFTGANWPIGADGGLTQTGCITTTTVGDPWPYPYTNAVTGYYWPYTVEKEVEPKSCMGKAHVFECEHVASCKCGAIKRVMPKPKKART